MNSSLVLIVVPMLCYFGVAINNLKQKDYPHAIVWFSYGLADCGFIWYELTKGVK